MILRLIRSCSYLIAKATRLILFLQYAVQLRRFRRPLLANGALLFLTSCLYFPLLFLTEATAITTLPIIAICFDVFTKFGLGAYTWQRQKKGTKDRSLLFPAYNHNHQMERAAQFVVIVFGEMSISSAYSAARNELGASPEYGRCALALLINFSLVSQPVCSDEHALIRLKGLALL